MREICEKHNLMALYCVDCMENTKEESKIFIEWAADSWGKEWDNRIEFRNYLIKLWNEKKIS